MNKAMSRIIPALFAVALSCIAHTARAQEVPGSPDAAEEDSPHSVTVSLNQDRFFGFYLLASGAYDFSEQLALTYYTIQWTIPGFGAGGGGQNLWTEFGGGINLSPAEGLDINPQLGILSGSLLSGADRGLFAEGIVPNVTINYESDLIESELYAGYYLALRAERPNNYLHYWANAGIKAPTLFSAGVHWEQLVFFPRGDDSSSVYRWLGPYAQFATDDVSMRFSGGVDFVDGDIRDFYKVTVAMTF